MNSCEKKELKAVLQKLSDKLEGKMVGGGAKTVPPIQVDTIDYIVYSSKYIRFYFEYNHAQYLVNIGNSLPDYNSLQKEQIKNVVITNDSLIILSAGGKIYNYKGEYNNINNMYGTFAINNNDVVDITITTTFFNLNPSSSNYKGKYKNGTFAINNNVDNHSPSNLNFSINFTNIHTIVNN